MPVIPPTEDTGNVYLAEVERERRQQILNQIQQLRAKQGLEVSEPNLEEDESALSIGRRVTGDVVRGVVESPRAVATGLVRAAQEFSETISEIGDPLAQFLEEQIPLNEIIGPAPTPDEVGNAIVDFLGGDPESVTGGAVQGITEFASGFLGGRGVIRLLRGGAPITRGGQLAEAAAAGLIADTLTVDEMEGNLSNFIQQFPMLENPVTEFLATDPDDPVATNKLKLAVEGVVTGGAADLLISTIKYGSKAVKALKSDSLSQVEKQARKAAEAGLAEAELPNLEVLGNPKAPAFRIDEKTVRAAGQFLNGDISAAAGTMRGSVNLNRIATDDDITNLLRKTSRIFISDPEDIVPAARVPEKFGGGVIVGAPGETHEEVTERLITKIGEENFDDVKIADIAFFDRRTDTFLPADEAVRRLPEFGMVPTRLMKERGDIASEELIKLQRKAKKAQRQTTQQTIGLANDIGADPVRMRSVIKGEGALTAAEITALRFHLNNSAERLSELASVAKGGDSAAQYEFMRQFNFHKALLERTSGAAREAGRTLQSLQIQGNTTKDASAAVKDLLDSGVPVRDLAEKFSSAVERRGAIAAHAFARMPESVLRRGGDALLEFWLNSLLSGPKTHVVNFVSNAIVNSALTPIERLTSVAVGKALRQEGVYWSEAGAMAMAMPRGMREGWRLARDALLNEDVADQFTKLDAPRTRFSDKPISASALGVQPGTVMASGVDMLGKVVRTPGRALNAADQFWKGVGYRIQLNADSWQRALSEGLEGEALARRFAELVDNPPPDLRMAAIDMARYNTFTNPLGDAGRNFQRATQNFPPLRLVFPFIKTPVNILKYAIHRSPAAPLTPKFRGDIAAGGNRARMAIARLGLGSTAMLAFADLATQGHISGSGPADPRLQAALRRTGWQPYSFKIGDQYFAYNRLDPTGLTIGMAADLSQVVGQLEDDEVDGLLGPVLTAVGENMINKTYLSGLANAMEVFNAPSEDFGASKGERYINNLLSSMVPNLFAQTTRAVDPNLRQAETLTQSVMRRIPGLSDELPPRLNLWGEPIMYPGGFHERLISPVFRSPIVTDSQIDQEIVKNQIAISMPARKVSFRGLGSETIELTQEQYNRYIELAGSELKDPQSGLGAKEMLEAIVTGRDATGGLQAAHQAYRNGTGGPEGHKAAIIKQVIQSFRTAAKAQLFQEDAELRDSVMRKRSRRLELLGAQP